MYFGNFLEYANSSKIWITLMTLINRVENFSYKFFQCVWKKHNSELSEEQKDSGSVKASCTKFVTMPFELYNLSHHRYHLSVKINENHRPRCPTPAKLVWILECQDCQRPARYTSTASTKTSLRSGWKKPPRFPPNLKTPELLRSQPCEPPTYWSADKMLHNEIRTWL